MHIAIDARIINSSTGRYIERLLTYLEKQKTSHTFSVIVPTKDKDYWKPSKKNFNIVTADYPAYSFGEQLGFARFLQDLKPDLVHFCMPQQPLLYTGPAVTTVHDLNLLRITENDDMSPLILRIKQQIFRGLLHRVVARSHHIITPSEYVKKDILSFHNVDPGKITVTYEAADLVSKKSVPVAAYKKVPFIMMVGRTESYKNHRGAIEALQSLLWKYPDLRLVIVGKRDESSHKLEQWALSCGLRNIDFFGFASDEQLAWLYEHCEAYIFPSFMEGFGLPGLEAMRHGAPVASSDKSSLPEVYGDAAIYFDPSDPTDISHALKRLLSDKKLRKSLIAKGKKRAASYSWQRMAKETLAIYNKSLVDGK